MSANREISLLSLDGEWIKLPLAVMQDVGPAVQTLGGILKMTNRETYASVASIAEKARLPEATVRKHLVSLDREGWINNRGREHTRRGRPRRTATLAITKKTLAALDGEANPDKLLYGVLPWWACCSIRKVGKLPWSAKAVQAVVMARLLSLKAAAERDGQEELLGAIVNMGGEDRFRFSLGYLMEQTGLTHDSVTTAKRLLHHRFAILRLGRNPEAERPIPARHHPGNRLVSPKLAVSRNRDARIGWARLS